MGRFVAAIGKGQRKTHLIGYVVVEDEGSWAQSSHLLSDGSNA